MWPALQSSAALEVHVRSDQPPFWGRIVQYTRVLSTQYATKHEPIKPQTYTWM